MIYAITMAVEKYNMEVDGNSFGMYSSYGHLPALFALIAIGTPLLYDWEGELEATKRRVKLTNAEVFLETLRCEIKCRTVETLLKTLDPLAFYEYIKAESLVDLPLVKDAFGSNEEIFKFVVGARSAAWGLSYRGKLSTTGKVIKVSFGGGMKIPADLQEMHNALKEGASHGKN